ncbi:MAG: type I methionyl aminopeptidase [Sphingomonadales bacterium]|nr:type I methionyl aminopeptidase [Sphingomonadales bacterium]
MIICKSPEEIALMREVAQVVSRTLGMLAREIRVGAIPLNLDRMAEEFIRTEGAEPAFKGMYGFPNTLCMSRNAQVVHGVPDQQPLREGDILSVDCGARLHGFYGDHAYTFAVGEVATPVARLLSVTRECLYKGIEQMVAGNRVGDISFAIQEHAERHGYGVVRELVGHGLGKSLHEKPEVPNYGRKGSGPILKEGLVLAIEPMINMGRRQVRTLADQWTVVTADGLPSAHFEHDVAIVEGKPEILSTFAYIEEALGINSDTNGTSV